MSADFPQHVLDRLGMLRDNRKQHSCTCIRPGAALLPIPKRCRRKAELGRELCLAEAHLRSNLPQVYFWHMHQRHSGGGLFAGRTDSGVGR